MLTCQDSYRLITRPFDEPKNLDGGSVSSYSVFPSSVLGLKINSVRALQDTCQMRRSGDVIICGLSQSMVSLCTLLLAFRVPFDPQESEQRAKVYQPWPFLTHLPVPVRRRDL